MAIEFRRPTYAEHRRAHLDLTGITRASPGRARWHAPHRGDGRLGDRPEGVLTGITMWDRLHRIGNRPTGNLLHRQSLNRTIAGRPPKGLDVIHADVGFLGPFNGGRASMPQVEADVSDERIEQAVVIGGGPAGLGMEHFCRCGDDLWEMAGADLIRMAAREMGTAGLADPAGVRDGVGVRQQKAYPRLQLAEA